MELSSRIHEKINSDLRVIYNNIGTKAMACSPNTLAQTIAKHESIALSQYVLQLKNDIYDQIDTILEENNVPISRKMIIWAKSTTNLEMPKLALCGAVQIPKPTSQKPDVDATKLLISRATECTAAMATGFGVAFAIGHHMLLVPGILSTLCVAGNVYTANRNIKIDMLAGQTKEQTVTQHTIMNTSSVIAGAGLGMLTSSVFPFLSIPMLIGGLAGAALTVNKMPKPDMLTAPKPTKEEIKEFIKTILSQQLNANAKILRAWSDNVLKAVQETCQNSK